MTGDHFWRGLLLVAALNALATAAALALGRRAGFKGAELGLATLMTWNFLVMCPVYALGLADQLYARKLALLSALFFVAALAIARGRANLRDFAADLARSAIEVARMPFEALATCARARSLVTLCVIFTFASLVWMIGCSYLTPSWKQWDALWYHEPMVGFAIQNHGLAFADLPPGAAQKINGYPKLCEMTQLWFVIFTDRRVIDMVGYLAAPGLALSVYLLARRYTRHRPLAIGLGCAIVLMPACVRLFGSTYIDEYNAAFVLAGAHFTTRPIFRIRDAMFAAICLALAGASKQMAIVPVVILVVVGTTRLLRRLPQRPWATVGALAFGASVIGGLAATVYLRNWRHFGNPFWPDFKYDNARLGIHWPGLVEWGSGQFDKGEARIDMNIPIGDLLKWLYRIPYAAHLPRYDNMYEYGLGMTWIAFPIAAIAFVALCVALVRDLIGRLFKIHKWRASAETLNLVPVALTLAGMLRFSPALWVSRYQISAVGLALGLVAWGAGRRGLDVLGEGVASALTVMAMVSFFWQTPRTWLTWGEAAAFAGIPYPAREFTPAATIGPTMEMWNGSPVTLEAGLAREKELGPGAMLAFSDAYGSYMALFWNNKFSNLAVWVPGGPDYIERLMKTDAMWAYCQTGDQSCSGLASPGSGWELVAPLDVENHGRVYRRTLW